MSSYITKWCAKHGEWDCDIDFPADECPECVDEGTAPSQVAAKVIADLHSELAALRAENEQLRATSLTLEQLEEIDGALSYCPACRVIRNWKGFHHFSECKWFGTIQAARAAKIREAKGEK